MEKELFIKEIRPGIFCRRADIAYAVDGHPVVCKKDILLRQTRRVTIDKMAECPRWDWVSFKNKIHNDLI